MNYRKFLIRLLTFLGGIYFFLDFVLPARVAGFEIGKYSDQISQGFVAVGAVALGLGVINLLLVHGGRLALKRKGWPYSAALLTGLFGMLIITSMDWRRTSQIAGKVDQVFILRDFAQKIPADAAANRSGVPPQGERTAALVDAVKELIENVRESLEQVRGLSQGTPEIERQAGAARQQLEAELSILTAAAGSAFSADASWYENVAQSLGRLANSWRDLLYLRYGISSTKRLYDLLYDGLYVPLGAAMFSLLGFYIATAAYRAFRVRSAESAFMMLAALVVMLGQIPFGIWLWQELPEVRTWLLRIPSAAAFRAITIGASIAALVMAFRMWFSIESENFGEKDK